MKAGFIIQNVERLATPKPSSIKGFLTHRIVFAEDYPLFAKGAINLHERIVERLEAKLQRSIDDLPDQGFGCTIVCNVQERTAGEEYNDAGDTYSKDGLATTPDFIVMGTAKAYQQKCLDSAMSASKLLFPRGVVPKDTVEKDEVPVSENN